MAIKTILFGTGKAAENFIDNNTKEREYLVAVDNDKLKHGQTFFDLDIVSVDKIKDFNYDEIVVASFFGLEIKHQLLKLGVAKNKIYLPQKHLLKSGIKYPFEDESTLKTAREFTKLIASKAYSQNLPLHIEWGTLIGVLRDGDLIRWDDDVDFSSVLPYKQKIEKFIYNIKNDIELKLKCELKILLTDTKVKLTIISLDKSFHNFDADIDFKIIKNNEAIQSSNQIWYTPSHHIEKLETFLWDDIKIFIPSDVDNYLKFVYGDWKTPKKDHSLDDYNNYKTEVQ